MGMGTASIMIFEGGGVVGRIVMGGRRSGLLVVCTSAIDPVTGLVKITREGGRVVRG